MWGWRQRRSRQTKIILLVLVVVVVIGALVPTEDESDERASGTTAATTHDATPPTTMAEEPDRPRGYVSRAEYGSDWPLTVEDGVLSCENARAAVAVYFTSGGKRYAVNEIALARDDAAKVDEIRVNDPASLYEGLKVNIGPLIQRGLELCD